MIEPRIARTTCFTRGSGLAAGCTQAPRQRPGAGAGSPPPSTTAPAAPASPTLASLPPGLVADPAAFAGQGRLAFAYQGGSYLIDGQRQTLEALPGGSVMSPDGRWLAWSVPDEGGSQLWVRPLGTDGPNQLTGLPPGRFTWSPDSKMLAVASAPELWVGGPGLQAHRVIGLSPGEEVKDAQWSPTSAIVAAASAHELWVGGPGTESRRVTSTTEELDLIGWSPDGQTLAYVLTFPSKDPPISSTELYAAPAGGGVPTRRYLSEEARILFAGWWPDSGGILFYPIGSASLLADGAGLLFLPGRRCAASAWDGPLVPGLDLMGGGSPGRVRRRQRESGTNCGSSRCHVLLFRRRHEGWVPAAEVSGKVLVEHARSDLEQEMGPSLRPAHLLLLNHSLAHHLVDRRLYEGVGDGLARAVALPVVRDPGGVGPDVAAELAQGLHQLAAAWSGVVDLEVHLQIFDHLQGTEHGRARGTT